jgi:aspartyl-tRNA(Asn)/glutamyl-tRNA(Gln) amidotransferase subunit A
VTDARSIVEIGAGLRRRELSAVEVANAALHLVDEWEPRLNAYIAVTRDRALAEAAAVDVALAEGKDLGPLMGIPYAVKDVFAADGAATTGASRALRDYWPAGDAEVVARLRSAGAVLVGKTNLHELGWGSELGRVGNPLDPSLLAGGSSGGSAATVGSGAIPVAIGTDAGGSIRLPAAFCGLVGFKPTARRVSNHGHLPSAWTVGVAGPIARSVADAQALFRGIASEGRSSESVPSEPRLGVIAGSLSRAEPVISAALQRSLDTLAEAGWAVEEVAIDMSGVSAAWSITYAAELAAALRRWLGHRLPETSDDLRAMISVGERIPAPAYLTAQRLRSRLFAEFEDRLMRLDALATPAVLHPPTSAEPSWEDEEYVGNGLWLQPMNLTGHPSVALPLAPKLSGASLQLVGRYCRDESLFELAAVAETALAG